MSQNNSAAGADDSLVVILLILLIFIGLPVMVWSMAHESISYWGLYFSWQQLRLFEWPIFPWVTELRAEIAELARQPAEVTIITLLWQMGKASVFLGWLPVLISALTIRSTLRHRLEKVRRPITVDTLPEIMSAHCKATIPVSYYGDLMNNDIPGHESRIHPAEFAERHELVINHSLDEEKTKKILLSMLGNKISKLSELKIYEKALFAVFASRVFDTSENAFKAQEYLDRLNESCHHGFWNGEPGYPDFSVLKKEIDVYMQSTEAQELLKFFYYPTTFLHKLHYLALKRGVLPSSNFRWLKKIDRGLWYVLNATDRKVPCMESLIQVQTYRAQNVAWSKGYLLKEPPVEQCISAFKTNLIAEGVLPKPFDHSVNTENNSEHYLEQLNSDSKTNEE